MDEKGSPAELFAPRAFSGRNVVITGGGNGIGRAIALRLARHGCAVALLDRDETAAQGARAEIDAIGGSAFATACDVADPLSIEEAVGRLAHWRSRIDYLVNCAGVVLGGQLDSIDPALWRMSFAINVDGVFHMCRALYPGLAASSFASIVNIGSLAGVSAYPGGGGYGPSKAAMIALSHQLAVEWAPVGIRVNVVNPATTLTPLIEKVHSRDSLLARAAQMPLGRLVLPDQIASTVCFLLSDAASAITGQAIAVDNGFSQTLTRPAVAPS